MQSNNRHDDIGEPPWPEKACCFGALKVTKAKENTYIQYFVDGKRTLLVNVQGSSCDCHKGVDALVLYACSNTGLEKAHMLTKRNEHPLA